MVLQETAETENTRRQRFSPVLSAVVDDFPFHPQALIFFAGQGVNSSKLNGGVSGHPFGCLRHE